MHQSVRVAAKELTSLILDDERLRSERSDRRSWKSRVTGLDEYGPPQHEAPRRQPRRQFTDEEDAEYRLAIEASKHQEEEDRRKRESRQGHDSEDDDLAKALKLSKEEEEYRRRRELEESNANLLFDDEPTQTPQNFNQGYQQGSAVDFFANPIDQSHMQTQPTGYVTNMYTGYPGQQTGYQNGFSNGFGAQPTGFDPYGHQNMQAQPTGYNPWAQQQQPVQNPVEQPTQPGSNNPWATTNSHLMAQKPMPTGSNNPFAQQSASRPTAFKAPSMPALSSLPEQKTLSTFT